MGKRGEWGGGDFFFLVKLLRGKEKEKPTILPGKCEGLVFESEKKFD